MKKEKIGIDVRDWFLKGYNKADGLKSNKCVSEFKNFKTDSACLASGLIYLLENTTKQEYTYNINSLYNIYIKRF